MSIEAVVRPFQTPDVSPTRPYYNAGKAAPQVVRLQFGRGGGGRTFSGSEAYTASFYMTQYVNEKRDADWGTEF